jgi:glutathione S-transferase
VIIPDEQVTTQEVKSWKGLHLLHFQSSSCSQKVRVLLREKGIPFESHPVDLPRQKHVSAWYLGINPRGVVPVIVHDGVVHVESNDILRYLDSEFPSQAPSFFPQNPQELAWVQENLDLEDGLHMDLRNLTMGFMMPRRFATKSEATLQRWEREGAENPKRKIEVQWWRDYARQGITPEQAQASVDAHRRAFETLDARLASSPWLIGDRISVLDIAWFITTTRLGRAGYRLDPHPNLARWHRALSQRPAFAEETRDPFLLRGIALPIYGLYRKLERTTLADLTT